MANIDLLDRRPQILLECGDWACQHSDGEELAAVAHELCRYVGLDERYLLLEIERLSELDMLQARGLWMQVTHGLRERYLGHEPDDVRDRC